MNKDAKNNEISIADLVSLFLSKLWIIIFAAVIGGVVAFSYSKFVLPLKYSSHISMYVQSYTGISENANNYNNISNSKQLVNTYMEVLKDDAVMNAVGDELKESFDEALLADNFGMKDGKISTSSLRNSLSISTVTDTSALNVSATTKNAELSAAVCNALAKVAPSYLKEAVGVGQINTIDTAKVYNIPVAPNMKKNTAIGAAALMMLAMLVIFLIDFFDNTIKDSNVLSDKYKKAIIGEIQMFDQDKKKKDEKEDDHVKLTDKDVPFAVVESYKSIRTNISFALSTMDKKIFLVSSTNPGEGKSTASANIAIALAQGGNKVLLIDADMRKSVQHKIFGLKNKKGLSSAISKMADLDSCITKDVMENLDVLTSGPVPPNPSELLASDSMTSIMETLRERYTTIIIDTPPVNVVTDSMELAKNVSGIVMVVRYGITTNDDVDEAMNKVNFSQLNVLGFIMNGVKVGGGKYYSKYRKYGKYGKYSKYGKYGKGYSYGYYGETPQLNDNSDSAETNKKTEPVKKDAPKSETVKKEEPKTEKTSDNTSQKSDSKSNKKNGKNKKGGK